APGPPLRLPARRLSRSEGAGGAGRVADGHPGNGHNAARLGCTTVRASGQKKPVYGLTRLVDTVWRLNHTAAMAVGGFPLGKSVYGWCSIRESARLAASVRGVEEAVTCCLEIARRCGMPLSEPA